MYLCMWCVYVYLYVYYVMPVCRYTCMHVCVHPCMQSMNVCMWTWALCMYACMRECMYVCMYAMYVCDVCMSDTYVAVMLSKRNQTAKRTTIRTKRSAKNPNGVHDKTKRDKKEWSKKTIKNKNKKPYRNKIDRHRRHPHRRRRVAGVRVLQGRGKNAAGWGNYAPGPG